jgi:hypothetical protein
MKDWGLYCEDIDPEEEIWYFLLCKSCECVIWKDFRYCPTCGEMIPEEIPKKIKFLNRLLRL